MGDTSIQWTDKTWSPLRARVRDDAAAIAKSKGYTSLIQIAGKMAGHIGPHCERVSNGCDNCYSDTNNGRCLPANGTGLSFDRRSRDLVEPFVDENILAQPLKWRKPVKVFVENQSDLFGEWVTDEQIDRVFAVMALCPQHTFQVLTKRPERMLGYFGGGELGDSLERFVAIKTEASKLPDYECLCEAANFMPIPYRNVWLGVSVENQQTADTRIPLLLQAPAAIRFVSYEPALKPVTFTDLPADGVSGGTLRCDGLRVDAEWPGIARQKHIDWIIVGGESGPGARPFDLAWARQTVEECKAAGVACFVKQLGAKPMISAGQPRVGVCYRRRAGTEDVDVALLDPKGGDVEEWPEDLRIREFPNG